MSDENPYVVGPTPRDEEYLRELYYGEGLTLGEMAERLDRGQSTIVGWMDDFGIERQKGRPRKDPRDR